MEFLPIEEIIRSRLTRHAAGTPAPLSEKEPTLPAPAPAPSVGDDRPRPRRGRRGGRGERAGADRAGEPGPTAVAERRAPRVEPVAEEPIAPAPPRPAPAADAGLTSPHPHAASERLERGNGRLPEGFAKLGVMEPLLRALRHAGFEAPTEIQDAAIPVALTARDLVGQAKTGTGKTAAFGLPILQRLMSGEIHHAIVLAPTRELALQVRDEIARYAAYSKIRAAAVYGGVPLEGQRKAVAAGSEVLVGTPGRVLDLARRGWLDLGLMDVVVLDECDRMFDLGFRPDIERIMRQMTKMKQLLLFSATINEDVERLCEKFSHDPVRISTIPETLTVDEVEQHFYTVAKDRKVSMMAELVRRLQPTQALVFVRTKIGCEKVAKRLNEAGVKASEMHGDLRQERREKILKKFRDQEINLLCATDVAARGLDIPSITHVFNYDIPEYPEDYVHRIGRTARMGAAGMAITLLEPGQGPFLTEIEKLTNVLVKEEKLEGFDAGSTSITGAAGAVAKPRQQGTGAVLFSTWKTGS